MPQQDGTGPTGARGRGGGGGRGMGRGRGPRRGQGQNACRAIRTVGTDQSANPSNTPVASAASRPQTFVPRTEHGITMEQLNTNRPHDARRASPSHLVARIDEDACVLCEACQTACPTEAIAMGEIAFEVNAEACSGCGACVEACPADAISLR